MTTKWNSKGPDAKKLSELFRKKQVDLTNKSSKYIKSVQDQPPIFLTYPARNFAANYRKLLQSFLIGKELQGARKEDSKFLLYL